MDEASVLRYITTTFKGLDILTDSGDTYIYYDPDHSLPHDRRFPFATIMTADRYDSASNLSRPDVYRLNIGISKGEYRMRFGPPPHTPVTGDVIDTGHDYTALDRIVPHPVYAPLSWVCVLNPGDATFADMQSLLANAYRLAVTNYGKRAGREGAK